MALIRPISTSESTTSLWQNSDPTTAYAASTVNLSDSISNYRYLKIIFRKSTSSADTFSVIVDTSELANTTLSTSNTFSGSCSFRSSDNVVYCRRFSYSAANSIEFSTSFVVNYEGSVTTTLIPTEIIGIK